jgi:propionyl-CoA synthetase
MKSGDMPVNNYAHFYQRSLSQPEDFWREQSSLIDWQQAPSEVLNYQNPPFAKWFTGGTTNLCHNAVDRHLPTLAN